MSPEMRLGNQAKAAGWVVETSAALLLCIEYFAAGRNRLPPHKCGRETKPAAKERGPDSSPSSLSGPVVGPGGRDVAPGSGFCRGIVCRLVRWLAE